MKRAPSAWILEAAAAAAVVLTCAAAVEAGGFATRVPAEALERKWDPGRLEYPPLGTLPVVETERVELPNGLVVHLVRDDDIPMVWGEVSIRAGTALDPPETAGLASLTATVLRTGGTVAVSGDSLDERLESLGASIEAGAGATEASMSFRCLAEHRGEVLGLFRDLILRPAFPQEKLDLAKLQMRRSIASRNDEPGSIAGRLVRQIVWGAEHPLYRDVELATLEPIGVEDLRAFQRRTYAPNRAILTVWGDIDPAAMAQELHSLFADWRSSEEPLPPAPPETASEESGGVHYAEKGQMTQSYVYVAQTGIRADHPDFPAIEVMAELLGGGFSSRLFNLIRTQRGLAYATGAGPGIGYAHPGTFTAYALTRSDSTLVTLNLLRSELDRIRSEVPEADEVRRAKEAILNSFVFNFSSPGQVARRQAYYEFYGYPADFLATYQERIRGVTAEEVRRAAEAYLDPDRMRVLIVGDRAAFAQPLESLGEYTIVDLTIPGAPPRP